MGQGVVGEDERRPAIDEVAALLVTLRPDGLVDAVQTLLEGRRLDVDEANVDVAWLGRAGSDQGVLFVRHRASSSELKAVLRARLRGPATAALGTVLDPRGRPDPVPGAWIDDGPPLTWELFNVAIERGYAAPR